MLSSVVSDTFGVSSMKIINHILENSKDTDFDVEPLLHGSMRDKKEMITKSINGNLTKPQAEKMRICFNHFDNIEKLKADLESVILNMIEPFMKQIELILTIPGIKDTFTAIAIIGEIGVDMSVFQSSKHLCSWAGLTPQNNESAGKKKSVRVSRAGVYIKPLLLT